MNDVELRHEFVIVTKLLPATVIKSIAVEPPTNFTQPFFELTFPDKYCPSRAPSTNRRVAPPLSEPVTDADVRPGANRIRVWANPSAVATAVITSATKAVASLLYCILSPERSNLTERSLVRHVNKIKLVAYPYGRTCASERCIVRSGHRRVQRRCR